MVVFSLQIFNLCIEEKYDTSHFHGRVEAYPFDDNHVPPLQMVKLFCESVYSWLSSDPKNIVVIHCMVCITLCQTYHHPCLLITTNQKNAWHGFSTSM